MLCVQGAYMNTAMIANKEVKAYRPSKSAARLKLVRQLHLYLGTLFAPAIIFFALSGSLQLFGLHEIRPGRAYQPPAWVQKMGSIHKNQTLTLRHGPPLSFANEQKRQQEAGQARRPHPLEGGRRNQQRVSNPFTLALKWFFLATAVGLISSTLLGIYMAFKFNRNRVLVAGVLFLGTAIPVALIAMMP